MECLATNDLRLPFGFLMTPFQVFVSQSIVTTIFLQCITKTHDAKETAKMQEKSSLKDQKIKTFKTALSYDVVAKVMTHLSFWLISHKEIASLLPIGSKISLVVCKILNKATNLPVIGSLLSNYTWGLSPLVLEIIHLLKLHFGKKEYAADVLITDPLAKAGFIVCMIGFTKTALFALRSIGPWKIAGQITAALIFVTAIMIYAIRSYEDPQSQKQDLSYDDITKGLLAANTLLTTLIFIENNVYEKQICSPYASCLASLGCLATFSCLMSLSAYLEKPSQL